MMVLRLTPNQIPRKPHELPIAGIDVNLIEGYWNYCERIGREPCDELALAFYVQIRSLLDGFLADEITEGL